MATNTPSTGSRRPPPVFTSRSRTPVTTSGAPPPTISSTTLSQTTLILGFANSRACRIFSARSASRRWMSVTLSAWWVRYSASSTAVLPPPTTATALPRIEEAVAGGAGRHAAALQPLLRIDAQPAGLGAGGDDHGVGQEDVARIGDAAERAGGEIHPRDQVVHDSRADMLGLRRHLLHQPRPLDHIGEARIVLDIGGDGQLPARLQPGHQHRRQAGARGIDRRRIACGAGADDQDARAVGLGHCGFHREDA